MSSEGFRETGRDESALDLTKLKFGSEAAGSEREALLSYFLQTEEYRGVREGTHWIIRGTKGSGKSAIAVKLLSEGNDKEIIIDVSPNAVGWQNLNSNFGFKQIQLKKVAWQAAFLNHVLDVIAEKGWKDYPLDAIEDLFRQADVKREHGQWKLREVGINLKLFSFKFGPENIHQAVDFAKFARAVEESLKIVSTALDADGLAVRLIVDGYDSFWNGDEQDAESIAALFLASQDLIQYAPWIRPQVFIRTDIWNRVSWDNKDHVKTAIVDLRWDSQKLKELLRKRIDFSLGRESPSPEAAVGVAFQSPIPGPRGHPTSAWDFIMRLIPMRPRDLIILCELARKQRASAAQVIKPDELKKGAELYSQERLDNIITAETPKTAPETAAAVHALRGARYKLRWRSMKDRLDAKDEAHARKLLDALLEFEVCGVEHDGKIDYHQTNPYITKLQVTGETYVVVHPGLRHALGTRMPYADLD